MIIPSHQLSSEALDGLIESFITREGTDYGIEEVSLTVKVQQVRRQLNNNEVLIVYDSATESVNIMTQNQYREWQIAAAKPDDDFCDQ